MGLLRRGSCSFACMVALVVPAFAGGNKVVAKTPVTENFTESKLEWRAQPKPGFILRWKTIVIDGRIAVCGVAKFPNILLKSESKDVLARTRIEYEGKTVIRDLRYVSKIRETANFMGKHANCALTSAHAPNGAYTVTLSWDAGSAKG